MPDGRIRALALAAVMRNERELLVCEGYENGALFYRPFGGTIEFGERSEEAVRREIREELGAELTDVCLAGVLENLFEYEGAAGHEVVFVYRAKFADAARAETELVGGNEDGEPMNGVWIDLSMPGGSRTPLYPAGLDALLRPPTDCAPS